MVETHQGASFTDELLKKVEAGKLQGHRFTSKADRKKQRRHFRRSDTGSENQAPSHVLQALGTKGRPTERDDGLPELQGRTGRLRGLHNDELEAKRADHHLGSGLLDRQNQDDGQEPHQAEQLGGGNPKPKQSLDHPGGLEHGT